MPLVATLDNNFGIMKQPQVKIIGGREYAATGSNFGPSYLPVDIMARMNNSAHQGLAMSAVVHDKQSSLDFEALAREPVHGVDTRKHLTMPSPERGPVASTFRPLLQISKPNDRGSVNSLSLLISMTDNPTEAAMVRLINSIVDSTRISFEDLLANMDGQTSFTVNSDSGSGTADNGYGAASSSATTTTSTAESNMGTPRCRRAVGGGSGGSGRKPGGTPRKKPASRADVIEKRESCERCKKSKAKCEPIPECIRCAKDGVECSLKETIMQETGRRLGACQRCKKNKVGCKKIESCGRCHKAEQPCSWAVKA